MTAQSKFPQDNIEKLYSRIQNLEQELVFIQKELTKKNKINDVLIRRVEKSFSSNSDAFSLFQAASALEQEVKDRTLALEAALEKLSSSHQDLEAKNRKIAESQSLLIHSEKMAALGQLVSGIAHEINTPLGAIGASVDNIQKSFLHFFYEHLKTIDSLSKDDFQYMISFLETHLSSINSQNSTREERQARKSLKQQLKPMLADRASDISEKLVTLGILSLTEAEMTAIKSLKSLKTIEIACDFLTMLQDCNTIDLAVARASKVAFSLKKFSHKTSDTSFDEVDINDSINTVLTLYQNQFKNEIELNKTLGPLPKIHGKGDELAQVWTNLIFNGIQAMQGNGMLTISTQVIDNAIQIDISDTGTGIPEEFRDKIFESFFTTKKSGEGTGLGLSISKEIIERHNGTLSFITSDQGTTFSVSLPVLSILKSEHS